MHVGVRGADRAIAVCDHLRERAAAAARASPRTRRSSTGRTPACTRCAAQIFTRTFPRCGVHEPFGDWEHLRGLRRPAERDRAGRRVDAAVVERAPPSRLRHGRAADLRRADARGRGASLGGMRRLHRPVGARLRRRQLAAPRRREIEENLWQAIRHGLDGRHDRLLRRGPSASRRGRDRASWTRTANLGASRDRRRRPGRRGSRRARTIEEVFPARCGRRRPRGAPRPHGRLGQPTSRVRGWRWTAAQGRAAEPGTAGARSRSSSRPRVRTCSRSCRASSISRRAARGRDERDLEQARQSRLAPSSTCSTRPSPSRHGRARCARPRCAHRERRRPAGGTDPRRPAPRAAARPADPRLLSLRLPALLTAAGREARSAKALAACIGARMTPRRERT